jgi:hypothetical protein
MKNLIFIIISFSLGFLIGFLSKFTYELNTFKPYDWQEPPVIINCYGKKFSKLHIIRAIEYWTVRNHKLGGYIHRPSSYLCDNEWLEGYIILRVDEKMSGVTLARTKRYTSLNNVVGAVISFQPDSFNLYLLNEHEIGHALGYSHVDVKGHVMHPIHESMGLDFYMK